MADTTIPTEERVGMPNEIDDRLLGDEELESVS